jgi:hypothetical protein
VDGGDAQNRSGVVLLEAADAPIFSADFNETGDADNDNDSDGADFLAWQRQFGSMPTVPVADVVPEPASLLLTLTGAIMVASMAQRPQ